MQQGTGWYGWSLDLESTVRALGHISEALTRYDRPKELGKLEISITPPPGGITLEGAKRYADLGVDRLILLPVRRRSEDQLKAFVSQIGETVLGHL